MWVDVSLSLSLTIYLSPSLPLSFYIILYNISLTICLSPYLHVYCSISHSVFLLVSPPFSLFLALSLSLSFSLSLSLSLSPAIILTKDKVHTCLCAHTTCRIKQSRFLNVFFLFFSFVFFFFHSIVTTAKGKLNNANHKSLS